MLRHVVMFSFKDDTTEEQKEAVAAARKPLTSCAGPGAATPIWSRPLPGD